MNAHTRILYALVFFTMHPAHAMVHNLELSKKDPFEILLEDICAHRNHLVGYIIRHNPSVVRQRKSAGFLTALAVAVSSENKAACKELLRCGASPQYLQSENFQIQELLDLYRNPSWFEKKFTIPAQEECIDDTCRMFECTSYLFSPNHEQAVTNQALLSVNPTWKLIKKHASQVTKDTMLKITLDDSLYGELRSRDIGKADPNLKDKNGTFYLRSTLIALAVCSGANPNLELVTKKKYETVLTYSIRREFPTLTRYLLDKGAQKVSKTILTDCTDLTLAKELIARGTPIPVHILEHCLDFSESSNWRFSRIPAFLNFYLHLGAELRADEDKNTALHLAAFKKNEKACVTIVSFFIEQHHSFLTFLWCLKQKYPALYFTNQRAFIKQYFGHLRPLKKLADALATSNRRGMRPYDLLPLEILKIEREKDEWQSQFTPRELYMRLKDRVHDERVV